MRTRAASPTAGATGFGPGVLALAGLLLVANALPSSTRLGASVLGGARVLVAGGTAQRALRAVLRAPELGGGGSSREDPWGREGPPHAVVRPRDGAPHEAALKLAAENGWARCPVTVGCAPAWQRLRGALGDDLAVEAVVLGDPDGERVRRAVAAARAARVARPEEPPGHAPFLAAEDRDRVDEVERTLGLATLWSLTWPVDPALRISSPFGPRVHPVLGTTRLHEGVDVAPPLRTPLRAPAAARVVHVGSDSVSGTYVVLDHGHAVTTVSCHLEEALVARGQEVASRALVARTGQSGRSTGPHLHLGVRLGGQWVDPLAALRGEAP